MTTRVNSQLSDIENQSPEVETLYPRVLQENHIQKSTWQECVRFLRKSWAFFLYFLLTVLGILLLLLKNVFDTEFIIESSDRIQGIITQKLESFDARLVNNLSNNFSRN